MKCFLVVLITLFLNSMAYGNNKEFLKCLGEEESYYHKKKLAGAYVQLNKKLISEFIQLSDTLTIKKQYQNEICNNKNILPSLNLLKLILIKKESLFISLATSGDTVQKSMDHRTKNELTIMGAHTLINFINELQGQASKPNCILNKVPELKDFYLKTRYTLEDQGIISLLNGLKNIDLIFHKLNDKNLLNNC